MLNKFSFFAILLSTLVIFVQCQSGNTPTEAAAVTPTVENEIELVPNVEIAPVQEITPEEPVQQKEETITPIVTKKEEQPKKVASKTTEAVVRKKEPVASKEKKERAVMKFTESTFKFGTIKQGDIVEHKFKFKNTGKAPLVIKTVDVSCGCTFPSYPFLPIEPGEEGVIEVTFNSEHKVGRQKPTVTVVTNASPRTQKLYLEGVVE